MVSEDYCVKAPTWSPNSQQIALLYFQDGVAQRIWVVDADGSDSHEVYASEDMQPHSGGAVWGTGGEQITRWYWIEDNDEDQHMLVYADGSGEAGSIDEVPYEWRVDYLLAALGR